MSHFKNFVFHSVGNAKQPSILNQMIAEAHELRENQAFRAAVPNPVPVVVKQNHADDSVRYEFILLCFPLQCDYILEYEN